MPPRMPTRVVSVLIRRPAAEVYAFASQPEQMWQWATGLGAGLRAVEDGEWEVDTAEGLARIRFAPPNDEGILDHEVRLASGKRIQVPLRIVPHPEGCEVCLTLFRTPGMSALQFSADAEWVLNDLTTLKRLMESGTD
jgi:hypothetical protein